HPDRPSLPTRRPSDLPGCSGRLIFTPCPGSKDTSVAEDLDTLRAAGAEAVITLMPSGELEQNQAADLPALCAERNLQWFHLPVRSEEHTSELQSRENH